MWLSLLRVGKVSLDFALAGSSHSPLPFPRLLRDLGRSIHEGPGGQWANKKRIREGLASWQSEIWEWPFPVFLYPVKSNYRSSKSMQLRLCRVTGSHLLLIHTKKMHYLKSRSHTLYMRFSVALNCFSHTFSFRLFQYLQFPGRLSVFLGSMLVYVFTIHLFVWFSLLQFDKKKLQIMCKR
jgi:hypothetical protein